MNPHTPPQTSFLLSSSLHPPHLFKKQIPPLFREIGDSVGTEIGDSVGAEIGDSVGAEVGHSHLDAVVAKVLEHNLYLRR